MLRAITAAIMAASAAGHDSAAQPMDHAHHHAMAGMPAAPITISINPEARVSVALTGPMPGPRPCAQPIALDVQVHNESFITSRLEARLVGVIPPGVSVRLDPRPLSGKMMDTRSLQIVLGRPGPVDLTVSFRAHNDVPDLGGRDRVHFLVNCR